MPEKFEDMGDNHFALAIRKTERDVEKVMLACGWIEKLGTPRTIYSVFILSGVSQERAGACIVELIDGGLLSYDGSAWGDELRGPTFPVSAN